MSLVPSLTELLWDWGLGPIVVGVTKFCIHPEAARERASVIGGTKDPDVAAIRGLKPDLIVADEDENRAPDIEALADVATVHVCHIDSVSDVAREIVALGKRVGRGIEAEAQAQRIRERYQSNASTVRGLPSLKIFVPVWRNPVVTIGPKTYMADLLRQAGAQTLLAEASIKYPRPSWDEVRGLEPQGVLLPTEPYRFRESHRAEYAQSLGLPLDTVRVVDGEAFTWFGSRTLAGLDTIMEAVGALRAATPQTP